MDEGEPFNTRTCSTLFQNLLPSTIYQWNRRFESVGVDGLKTKRGRPPM
ncbi:helix-turn-helix domain-containing protein, partial [Sporolactobacillus shoreicorticis]